MQPKSGRVLSIAGSDSSGGAGIQADIKTITMLGGYAATAITALTAQNTTGVQGVELVSPEFIRQQAKSVLADIGADVIKTGMLANAAIIKEVAKLAGEYLSIPLVVDPVMVATSGDILLEKEALTQLNKVLLPLATLVTPNIPEAELLAHILISREEGMMKAGRRIIDQTGCKAVLVKGGHLEGQELLNVLVTKEGQVKTFHSTRIHTKHTHGTGCTLASAIATGLAQNMPLDAAIQRGCDYVHQAILHAPELGQGSGPLGHGQASSNIQ